MPCFVLICTSMHITCIIVLNLLLSCKELISTCSLSLADCLLLYVLLIYFYTFQSIYRQNVSLNQILPFNKIERMLKQMLKPFARALKALFPVSVLGLTMVPRENKNNAYAKF